MGEVSIFSKALSYLLPKEILAKLDIVATVNVLLIFGLLIFIVADKASALLLEFAYAAADIAGNWFGKTPISDPTIAVTPFWQYGLFLLIGFGICMFIVKKRKEGGLW